MVLKYPEIRENLKFYVKELADGSWIDETSDEGSSENIEYIMHFFFDDTSLSEDPSAYIGLSLIDETEAVALEHLISKLDLIFNIYGTNLSDQAYLEKPEWKDVESSAIELNSLITRITA